MNFLNNVIDALEIYMNDLYELMLHI